MPRRAERAFLDELGEHLCVQQLGVQLVTGAFSGLEETCEDQHGVGGDVPGLSPQPSFPVRSGPTAIRAAISLAPLTQMPHRPSDQLSFPSTLVPQSPPFGLSAPTVTGQGFSKGRSLNRALPMGHYVHPMPTAPRKQGHIWFLRLKGGADQSPFD